MEIQYHEQVSGSHRTKCFCNRTAVSIEIWPVLMEAKTTSSQFRNGDFSTTAALMSGQWKKIKKPPEADERNELQFLTLCT